jgi:hypothetical protein
VNTSDEDRSRWLYEESGPPLLVVQAFLRWLEILPVAVDVGECLFTPDSWPIWRESALDGSLQRLIRKQTHWSTTVRYPADGMAYVAAPILHPDQDEAVLVTEEQLMPAHVYTLLHEDGEWKIHSVGGALSPAQLGKTAYSW